MNGQAGNLHPGGFTGSSGLLDSQRASDVLREPWVSSDSLVLRIFLGPGWGLMYLSAL